MEIKNLAENASDFTGNVFLLKNGENVLIDTGTGDTWEEIRKQDSIDKVVLTHSHYDHADNLPKIVDRYNPKIYAFEPENPPVEAEKIGEGVKLELCGENFKVFHTPGHKDDSICLYSNGKLFSGDLIFPDGGFGRTDLAEGDRDKLINSIKKIVELEVKEMYPGHESATKENVESQIQNSLEQANKHRSKY